MKIAVQNNNLVGQIWYRSLDHDKKKRRLCQDIILSVREHYFRGV